VKGIILAGGSGTRLYPLTNIISKQLLPIYDKPMIYYPLSILMLANIKEILIISTPTDLPNFEKLLGDGSRFGITLAYAVQEKPEGLAQAFIIGEKFIGTDSVALVLGDNIFYGAGISQILKQAALNAQSNVATIFGYYVDDPERFGNVLFDKLNKVISIEEKPKNPKSNYCITGLYFYDNSVVKLSKEISPSERGELEITDINKIYLSQGNLQVKLLGRGYTWFDTGTQDSLLEASNFVQMIEKRQSIKISALEEIAFVKGWIDDRQLNISAQFYGNSSYGKHLTKVLEGRFKY
jgi:glucose-1-phosphate thymidylyltransferase